jgi:hypothetical protein
VGARKTGECLVPPREGRCFHVPAGHFFRITSVEGPQVGDLDIWSAADPRERFYSGKTRALHGTHLTRGDRLWSSFPHLRPMATITEDTLEWYGIDEFGGSVHDVIGTRCDPYTHHLLSGQDYHHCCHSNLTNALIAELGPAAREAEPLVHDVLNVFMCTGFTRDTGQYFMKASPVRPGDYLEILRRDRPDRRAFGLSGRRLRQRAFQRHRRLPSAAGRDLRPRPSRSRARNRPRTAIAGPRRRDRDQHLGLDHITPGRPAFSASAFCSSSGKVR